MQIALYPHVRYGMQSTSEAVQLCERFKHPRLGIVFNGYHWFATQEGELELRLDTLWPWLKQVNIAGCRLSPLGWGARPPSSRWMRGKWIISCCWVRCSAVDIPGMSAFWVGKAWAAMSTATSIARSLRSAPWSSAWRVTPIGR
nr:sugar phosphate isomerase/epimerase [Pseudomonas benzenivorans]